MNTVQLNRLAKRVHAQNVKAGWWSDLKTGKRIDRNPGELLMLVVTELAEAVEGIRKNLMDDKLPHRKMEEVELADAVIRLLDFVGGFKLKIHEWGADVFGGNKCETLFDITACLSSANAYTVQHAPLMVSHKVSRTIAMIVAYCARHNLDLWGAVEEKLAYNKTRQDHKPENRRKANGKKL